MGEYSAYGATKSIVLVPAGDGTYSEPDGTSNPVRDDYDSGECLTDQTGADGVLTFTFSAEVSLVVVDVNGEATDVCRADPFGGTPTSTKGVVCRDEAAAYMPVRTTSVKVYAPSGVVVSVVGYRRS